VDLEKLLNCSLCPRLRLYASSITPPPRFKGWNYWSKPVPGFGDPNAEIMILGLAPAAHGGNRTGRAFTGDESGKWVIRGLYELGLANKPESVSKGDGLQVYHVYITNAVKCVPPKNKPSREEIKNCSHWLIEEIKELKKLKVIVALGKIAFDSVCKIYGVKAKFEHGKIIRLPDGKYLISSYHVSAQNTRTGRLTWEGWLNVLKTAVEFANIEKK